jgi:fatty acid desaturase
MTDQTPTPHAEQPRSEPEIIPPGQDPWRRTRSSGAWYFKGGQGTHRIYFTKLGPFSSFLIVAAFGLLAALLLIVLLGAFLIWIPILGFLIAVGIISALLRGHFRR